MPRFLGSVLALLLLAAVSMAQQPSPSYAPKFPGDPARSDKEAAALGYMRVVLNAETLYRKRHGVYATSLDQLVNQGSFTRRMVATNRGDYTVRFKGAPDKFQLWLTPRAPEPALRAFFSDETGRIRAEETRAATPDSPSVSARN